MSFSGIVASITISLIALPLGAASGKEKSAEIAEAVSPLPESLRAGATVLEYDAHGNSTVLRQGTNGIICSHDRPLPAMPFGVRCSTEVQERRHEMMEKLLAEGKTHEQAQAAVLSALESGKLPLPPAGTMMYAKTGKTAADAKVLWIMFLPNAKAESLGLPTKQANGSPWMMFSGTPRAHVMIPQTEAHLEAAPTQRP